MRAWSEVLDVDRPANEVLRAVSVAATGVAGARVAQIDVESVSIVERRRPGWAFWLALLLFPFGLLALLYKRKTRLVVSVGARRGSQLRVRVNGVASEKLSHDIGQLLGYEPDLLAEGGSIGRLDDAVYFVFRFVPSTDQTRLVCVLYLVGMVVAFALIKLWPIFLAIVVVGYFVVIAPIKRWERSRQAAEELQTLALG